VSDRPDRPKNVGWVVREQSTPEEREWLTRLEKSRVAHERLAANRERERAQLAASGAPEARGPNGDQRPGRRRRETARSDRAKQLEIKHDRRLAAALRAQGFDTFPSKIERRLDQAKTLANPLLSLISDLDRQLRSVFVRQHGRRGPPEPDEDDDDGGPGWGQALRKLTAWLGIEKEISRGRQ
jgi:hypothetical protein